MTLNIAVRSCIVVINNFLLPEDYNWNEKVRFAIWQHERGASGTEHTQGYIEFKEPIKLGGIKKFEHFSGAHLEKRLGSRDQAIAYSRKEETRINGPFTFGDEGKGQGRRSDLTEISAKVQKGERMQGIAESHPEAVIRYHKGIQALIEISDKRIRPSKVDVILHIGIPGTGKTFYAHNEFKEIPKYIKGSGTQHWWDGYEGEDIVVLDEFKGWIQYTTWCGICDRYPMRLEYKGGTKNLIASKIYITTNYEPIEWWTKGDFKQDAIYRRITKVRYFRELGQFREFESGINGTAMSQYESYKHTGLGGRDCNFSFEEDLQPLQSGTINTRSTDNIREIGNGRKNTRDEEEDEDIELIGRQKKTKFVTDSEFLSEFEWEDSQ